MIKRANGQGSVYKAKSGHWRAAVVIGYRTGKDGKPKRIVKTKTGFTKKSDAMAALAELRNQPIGINMDITFKALYELWSKSHYENIVKDTENVYKASYKHCGSIHQSTFTELKTADLQAVVDNATRIDKGNTIPLGWKSKKEIKNFISALYSYAIENDYSSKNYASFIKLPTKPKSTKDAFNSEEIAKFHKDYENGSDFTGYILIMIYTGMRYGELAKIEKQNIHIEEKYMIGGIKTEAGTDRTIPIADKILPIIQKYCDRSKKKILDIHEKVFYNNFYVTLERLDIRKLSPHCCRHTFATLMANAGVQPAIITETAGHEDYATTLQYTHIALSEKLKAVNSL